MAHDQLGKWLVGRCRGGEEIAIGKRIDAQFGSIAEAAIPKFTRYMMTRKKEVFAEDRAVLPNIVFVRFERWPNFTQFFGMSQLYELVTIDNIFATVRDREIEDLYDRAEKGEFGNEFTRSMLFFTSYVGKQYRIKSGIFCGYDARILEIKGTYVRFSVEVAGGAMEQSCPIQILFSGEKTMRRHMINLACGLKLNTANAEDGENLDMGGLQASRFSQGIATNSRI
jgi:transcription antitermination factor NusG